MTLWEGKLIKTLYNLVGLAAAQVQINQGVYYDR